MQRVLTFLATGTLFAVLGVAAAGAAGPFHVCGTVTEYFVTDIPSGGLIAIDGKNYPIASSASYTRKQPLPDVQKGANVCVDGTTNDSGQLLDFTVTPIASQNSASASPSATTGPQVDARSDFPTAVWAIALVALVAVGAAWVLRRRWTNHS